MRSKNLTIMQMMKLVNKKNTILSIFLIVAIAYLIWSLFSVRAHNEHFTVDQPSTAEYNARLYTIKIFENVIGRKPTPEEITQFSKLDNEQDILTAIMAANTDEVTNKPVEEVKDATAKESVEAKPTPKPTVEEPTKPSTSSADLIHASLKQIESQIALIRNAIGVA